MGYGISNSATQARNVYETVFRSSLLSKTSQDDSKAFLEACIEFEKNNAIVSVSSIEKESKLSTKKHIQKEYRSRVGKIIQVASQYFSLDELYLISLKENCFDL